MKLRGVRGLLLLIQIAAAAGSSPAAESPAHQAARQFMCGVNFGNFLEVPPRQGWSLPHTTNDLALAKAQGFDHVRLPVGWHHYCGPAPDFKLSDEIFAKVDHLVTNAAAMGLGLIINIHHFDDFTTDPAANTAKFVAIWRQIAEHYASAPPSLGFELLNEPKDAAKTTVINPIYAEAIREIRRTNPQRVIFVGPGKWNSVNELENLQLPEDDRNIIVTVHCYEPFYFTHQGATWAGNDTKVTGIHFPGPPKEPLAPPSDLQIADHVKKWIAGYNTLSGDQNPCSERVIRSMVAKAKAWSEKHGRPIHFGEFGCYTKADPESRARYYATFRSELGAAGMGWAIWDWKAGFRYWDAGKQQPAPGMREALFPTK